MRVPTTAVITLADGAANAATLNPTALALLSIFGGAALTVVAGFIGAWLQSRREHQRWLRDKRLEAFLVLEEWLIRFEWSTGSLEGAKKEAESGSEAANARLEAVRAERAQLKRDQAAAWAALGVLGPAEVDEALSKLLPPVLAGDEAAIEAHFAAVERTMRRSLKITG